MRNPIRLREYSWLAAVALALPAIAVAVWLLSIFPSYLGARFFGDVIFALAWCGLLALVSRWRVVGPLSWPLATLLYVAWLLLVFSEAVSYYLQADTFNARFFAQLNPDNLDTGLHAFPALIGGGLVVLIAFLVFSAWLLRGRESSARPGRSGPSGIIKSLSLLALLVVAAAVDSAPHRLGHYLMHYEQSFGYADTRAGRQVLKEINPDPVARRELMAAPGKNLVILYMESLERMYTDLKAFPGLTPNLDRLRAEGLDFSGFETFSGTTYTIAGMFSSQCGAPLFSSPFSAFDYAAGNNNDDTTFQPKLVCLGDVLHAAGYQQVYLGGAPIVFSRKGLFYKLHGYDEALGLKELEAQAGGKLPESGWGLFDVDLFRLALDRYRQLEHSRKPFNLAMITLDTHPPSGRPSPGCPRYTASNNDMLQAVHCTDYLVGRFIDQLSREPDWKNTVVLVMSDHLAMRNDSEPLYPKGYHRQPLMFVLNAGHGQRTMRFYHMDIAPTLLGLMGVHNNATFIAGADHSSADAPGNPLVDSDVVDAVLRKVLWSKVSEFRLCKKNTLIKWATDGGFDIGGREVRMAEYGEPAVAIKDNEALIFLIDNANVSAVLTEQETTKRRDQNRGKTSERSDLHPKSNALDAVLAARGNASALTITPVFAANLAFKGFSVEWIGRHGGHTHIAMIPRLRGLEISAPNCDKLIEAADALPARSRQDDRGRFTMMVAPTPTLEKSGSSLDFRGNMPGQPQYDGARAAKIAIGWLPAAPWGSLTWGNYTAMLFKLTPGTCRRGMLVFTVRPFLTPSRQQMDAHVLVDNREAAIWHFSGRGGTTQTLSVPINPDASCEVNLGFRFRRPPPLFPLPPAEDPRDLQLTFIGMHFQELSSATH